jgi:putative salt-induced outer membrane protein YdiY
MDVPIGGSAMNKASRGSTALLLIVLSGRAFAQDPSGAQTAPAPAPTPPAWTGAAQVSFLGTRGNTETSVLGLGAEAKYKGASPWSVAAKAALNRGKAGGAENLRNFLAVFRVARSFDSHTDLFVEAGYAEDIYSGIDSRLGAELGVSRKLRASEPHLLSVEAGLGVIHEVRLPGKTDRDFATGRAGINYKYVISKNADFQEQFSFTENLDNTKDWRLANAASLTAAIRGRFALKLSHALARLNMPPLGKKKTDTVVSVALVAKF